MSAGKLDVQAQVGCFVRYDSESKGYRIYWPGKWSISVEGNMVFNKNNTAKNVTINPCNTLDEGEREKVIQCATNNVEDVEEQEETENPNKIGRAHV